MALFGDRGSKKGVLAVPESPGRFNGTPRSLVASALSFRFDDQSYNTWQYNWRSRDEAWQRELWRLYDITPELRFAASWVGQCCSRVRIFVANVDNLGRVQGETRNKKIQALSDTLLGGPASKAEHLRMMGIDLTVAGECYIIGRPGAPEGSNPRDQWFVVTGTEFRRIKSTEGGVDWLWGPKDAPVRLDLETSIVTRVWTPHPLRVWCADSPARSCQIVLRELEQLTKYVASQIDSRLVGAGILIIPNNLDLPQEENVTTNAESLMIRLATAGAASLRGEGTALGVLPHIIEAENPDGFKLLSFDSELSKQAMDLRKEAIERLGVGMDMPPEILTGTGGENHWNSYLIEGQGIKTHIEPLMNRICDALTKAYLIPALQIMGEDPGKYTYAFDTSPLIVRPQRTQDALNLFEKGEISGEALRETAFFKESDAPNEEERARRLLIEVILRDPQLIQNQAIRKAIGLSEEILPQTSMIAPTPQSVSMGPGGGSGPPPPPAPPTGIQSQLPPPIPDTLNKVGQAPPMPNPGGKPGPPPSGITASAAQMQEMGVVVLAEATVRRALELAGKRLLNKDNRNRWPDVPHHELHTRIFAGDRHNITRLLSGAWDQLEATMSVISEDIDTQKLQTSLENYCRILLTRGLAHDPPNLFTTLQADGIISGQ